MWPAERTPDRGDPNEFQRTQTWFGAFRAEHDVTADTTTFALDRRTAALLKELKPNDGPVAFLLKLHVDLFFGLPGNVLASTAQGCILLHAIGKGVASGRISRLLAMPARPDRRAGAA